MTHCHKLFLANYRLDPTYWKHQGPKQIIIQVWTCDDSGSQHAFFRSSPWLKRDRVPLGIVVPIAEVRDTPCDK